MTTKRKQLTLHVTDESQKTRACLSLISGIRGFTTRELDVLEVLINKRNELTLNQVKGIYMSQLLFSTTSRKEYADTLKITEFNLTNILSSLKKKQAILFVNKGEYGEYDDIDPNLLPADEITIRVVVND